MGISSLSSIVHEISKFVRFPQGGGVVTTPPGVVWNDHKSFRTGYGINMIFCAKRVKMIRLQLYGSDFVNSVRKKWFPKTGGSARVNVVYVVYALSSECAKFLRRLRKMIT